MRAAAAPCCASPAATPPARRSAEDCVADGARSAHGSGGVRSRPAKCSPAHPRRRSWTHRAATAPTCWCWPRGERRAPGHRPGRMRRAADCPYPRIRRRTQRHERRTGLPAQGPARGHGPLLQLPEGRRQAPRPEDAQPDLGDHQGACADRARLQAVPGARAARRLHADGGARRAADGLPRARAGEDRLGGGHHPGDGHPGVQARGDARARTVARPDGRRRGQGGRGAARGLRRPRPVRLSRRQGHPRLRQPLPAPEHRHPAPGAEGPHADLPEAPMGLRRAQRRMHQEGHQPAAALGVQGRRRAACWRSGRPPRTDSAQPPHRSNTPGELDEDARVARPSRVSHSPRCACCWPAPRPRPPTATSPTATA